MVEYLLGQLLVYGPLIGFLLFWAAAKWKAEDRFQRTMKWCLYGVFGFFLLSSFRGRVEANWTAGGIIPLLYLSYRYIENRERLVRRAYQVAVLSLVLIFAFRLVLAIDIFPKRVIRLSGEFHGWKAWASDLQEIAGETPVIFYNDYQKASKYLFYAKKKAQSVSKVDHAGNQFDWILEAEKNLQGQTVLLVEGAKQNDKDYIVLGNAVDKITIDTIENFHYTNRLRIKGLEPLKERSPNERILQSVELFNPTDEDIVFVANEGQKLELRYFIFEFKRQVKWGSASKTFPLERLKAGERKTLSVELETPEIPGKYRYRIAIYNGKFNEQNSNFQKLIVRE